MLNIDLGSNFGGSNTIAKKMSKAYEVARCIFFAFRSSRQGI
jgi:hypothetical protein